MSKYILKRLTVACLLALILLSIHCGDDGAAANNGAAAEDELTFVGEAI